MEFINQKIRNRINLNITVWDFALQKGNFFKYRLAKPTTQYVDIHQNLSKVELKTQNQETQIKMGHHY